MRSRIIEEHREKILELAASHRATDVRVFGSLMRGEGATTSDLDLLVTMEEKRSLLNVVGLSCGISSALSRRSSAMLHDQSGACGTRAAIMTEDDFRKWMDELHALRDAAKPAEVIALAREGSMPASLSSPVVAIVRRRPLDQEGRLLQFRLDR